MNIQKHLTPKKGNILKPQKINHEYFKVPLAKKGHILKPQKMNHEHY